MLHPLRPIADGNVTAATDALGRVTASSYDDAGQQTAGYQGQVLSGSGSWNFTNLTPNNQLSYEIYVQSSTPPSPGWQEDYFVTGGTLTRTTNPTDTPLGDGWYDLGSVEVSVSTSALTVTGGSVSTQVCLMQQTSATAYDADGRVTATTDALGRVTASFYDALGRDTNTTTRARSRTPPRSAGATIPGPSATSRPT